MPEVKFYHVETCVDGKWSVFTTTPIEGIENAEAHLKKVQKFAESCSKPTEHVRIRELGIPEVIQFLTQEEKNNIVVEHIKRVGFNQFIRQLYEVRTSSLKEPKTPSWFKVQ